MSHTDPTPNPDPTAPLLATIQRQQLEIIELNKKLDAADQAAVAASAVEKQKADDLRLAQATLTGSRHLVDSLRADVASLQKHVEIEQLKNQAAGRIETQLKEKSDELSNVRSWLQTALNERDRARHLVSQYEQGLRVHPNANNAAVREAKTLRMALRDLSIVITSLCESEPK